ncbi:hypothetical protein [Limobrevibacterium gyesilva]|uniref:Uncharacterized protein n=1 Tax=Limobrevibacterium gyesilva TaxID=2991712 RepID=A0AA42CCX2_9PROT|nr:hypothetical protein [Limobrevibacterium gyesilva]MCW3474108.1 hypothetical protein [Limobrevibacterium gyesilva]
MDSAIQHAPETLPHKVYRIWWHEMKLFLPPAIYFFCAFNIIVLTTNLLVHDYWYALTNFALATGFALVVGKAVLVADSLHAIDRFRGAPLIFPVLYKTAFYTLVTFIARMLEQTVHFALDANGFGPAFAEAAAAFTWHRFAAIQIWIFVCFLIYTTVSEIGALLGPGQLTRLFFRYRPSYYKLTRRQHMHALMEISRLAETKPRERLLDPGTEEGAKLVRIIDALRRRPA